MPELEPAPKREKHSLLIDQGNSRIKWIGAVWSARSKSWSLDLTTFGEGTVSDLEAALESGEIMPPEEVLMCSVSGDSKNTQILKLIKRSLTAPVTQMASEESTHGIENGYSDFGQLGVDRWMAVVGAAVHHSYPVVVMDLGTATTLDAVDVEGNHLGGLILPGPLTMLESLGVNTAMTVDEAGSFSQSSIRAGNAQVDTNSAIAGGVITAQIAALDQFIGSLGLTPGSGEEKDPDIVVTGGAAGAILGKSDHLLIHDPLLVFKGMLICRYGAIEKNAEGSA